MTNPIDTGTAMLLVFDLDQMAFSLEVDPDTLKSWAENRKPGLLAMKIGKLWRFPNTCQKAMMEWYKLPEVMDRGDVAAIMQLHPDIVTRLLKSGELPNEHTGRSYAIKRANVMQFLGLTDRSGNEIPQGG